jgi:hypothetical protein
VALQEQSRGEPGGEKEPASAAREILPVLPTTGGEPPPTRTGATRLTCSLPVPTLLPGDPVARARSLYTSAFGFGVPSFGSAEWDLPLPGEGFRRLSDHQGDYIRLASRSGLYLAFVPGGDGTGSPPGANVRFSVWWCHPRMIRNATTRA